MANILYLPFPKRVSRNRDDRGLRANALELQTKQHADVFFSGQEFLVDNGDTLVVNGHGGTGRYTKLTDNAGSTVEMDDVINDLVGASAHENKKGNIVFFVCYSAERGHIAWKWKNRFPATTVYGTVKQAQGALATFTRQDTVRNSIFSLMGQVTEVTLEGSQRGIKRKREGGAE
jgi:hypothetical protein